MANPAFPRTILPIEVSSLEAPGPLISKAQSGRVNIRSLQQSGHTWTERYLVNVRSVNGRALLAAVNNFWRNGTVFTITHMDHLTPLGAGGGTPLVNQPPQLVTDPENFGAWSINGAVGRSGGQSDPLGGTAGYLLDSNTPGVSDAVFEGVTFTGNATKALAVWLRTFSSSSVNVALWDNTASVMRHRVTVSWLGDLTLNTVTLVDGSGTIFMPESWPDRWYRIAISAVGVVAANANQFFIYPDVGGTGSACYAFGANAWNSSVPAGYIGPSHLTATGDRLYVDGATASVTNWARAGDILRKEGYLPVHEVTADVNSQAGGYAVIPINPPIFPGGAPADNTAITLSSAFYAVILEPPTFPSTSGTSSDYGELVVKFSEFLG